MFEFTDLDGMSRLFLLKKREEAVKYWRTIYRLKGAFVTWGSQTQDLLAQYASEAGATPMAKEMSDIAKSGSVTVKKLTAHIEKVDAYLRDIDARLADGSKWYSAQDIAELFEKSERGE